MNKKYDIIVVGAGIVGLAVALAGEKKGKKVAVFERNPRASGASIRNFGLVWPIGQTPGIQLDRALRSRAIWLELAEKAGISVQQNGSLTLAYHEDEHAVLTEFMEGSIGNGYDCQLVTPVEIANYSSATRLNGLKGGLLSHSECTVSPRQALAQIASYLEETKGVDFYWNKAITHVETGKIADFIESWEAERVYICSGQDFETLYPTVYAAQGITRCKLQMMRTDTQPNGWKLGPSLCAGLTLQHYANFAHCPSLANVAARYDEENPKLREWGIHVLLSQNANGELIIGDSHEYGLNVSPFDNEAINHEILKYLNTFAHFPETKITERWHGVYPKLSGQHSMVIEVEPNVWIINGLGGAGMTLSFGLTEEYV
jgi:FAD dependent oxidoreductase TIGR03364